MHIRKVYYAVGAILVGHCPLFVHGKEAKLNISIKVHGIDVSLPFAGVVLGHGDGVLNIPVAKTLASSGNKEAFASTQFGRSCYEAQRLCVHAACWGRHLAWLLALGIGRGVEPCVAGHVVPHVANVEIFATCNVEIKPVCNARPLAHAFVSGEVGGKEVVDTTLVLTIDVVQLVRPMASVGSAHIKCYHSCLSIFVVDKHVEQYFLAVRGIVGLTR